ncbi:calponin homology domain-containing protein [Leucosporidium creatinivorum]|uniref:Calponin homology domain-containing protein n=1 Tax=Leucosporidium creatinivorum TaxID=106004 RepID=A0A1Y2G4Z5_9BASI|nr:calponin homology domain-containing protein [Leucosporidium creatinivorum]
MAESRSSLLQWINELLQLQLTKVEQCGTGAVYCQIIDSIYGDVPMNKVKMNTKQQYEYLANFKVLQNTFKQHSIDKPIPVDRLVNCKMQDNLEFLQWLKKYWDLNFPGGAYDAVARRGGKGIGGAADGRPTSAAARPAARASTSTASSTTAARRPLGVGSASRAASSSTARPASRSAGSDVALQQLTTQMNEMKLSVEGLEKERDFYFNKLRDIEILIGARLESEEHQDSITEEEREQLLAMQQILYSTEDGFEVPEGEEEGLEGEELPLEDEEETF